MATPDISTWLVTLTRLIVKTVLGMPDQVRRARVVAVTGTTVSLGWPDTDVITSSVTYPAGYAPEVGDEVYTYSLKPQGIFVLQPIRGLGKVDQDGSGGQGSFGGGYVNSTVAVASTSTGQPGTAAKVTNVGTATNAALEFVVPRGAAGKDGADGVATATSPLTYDASTRAVGPNSLLRRLTAGEGPTPPTSGTWSRGDHYWNTQPTAGGNDFWVCTASGTPGTWVASQLLTTS